MRPETDHPRVRPGRRGAAVGSALPAIRRPLYFHGRAITRPLLVPAAWAAQGVLVMTLGRLLPTSERHRNPLPGRAVGSCGRATCGAILSSSTPDLLGRWCPCPSFIQL